MKIKLKQAIKSIFLKQESNDTILPKEDSNYEEKDPSKRRASSINLPWVESPFFYSSLEERFLTNEQRQQAIYYHENGYLIFEQLISPTIIDELKQELKDKAFNPEYPIETPRYERRIHDFVIHSKAAQQISRNKHIIDTLNILYERKSIVFQSIHFRQGSNQKAHSDIMHFDSIPHNYMCGAWVALEDITMENGPVFFYPKSNQLPQYYYEDILPYLNDCPSDKEYEFYEEFIEELMSEKGLEKKYFTAKKGDVLLWSANLIHGGFLVTDQNSTRYSQVTHYLFEDCIYHRPIHSNLLSREKHIINDLKDLTTGEVFTSNCLTNQQYLEKQITKEAKELNIQINNIKHIDKLRIIAPFYEGFFIKPIIEYDLYNLGESIEITSKATIIDPTTEKIILT